MSGDEGVFPGAKPDDDNQDDSADEDEGESRDDIDDFIVEDDGDDAVASLPAAFSMNSHQDLVHHFKVVCQYHVHLAVTADHARRKRANRLTKGMH